MKRIYTCFLLIALSLNLYSQDKSYIQIVSEPNINVYVNNEFKGKTSIDLGGIIIKDLASGKYSVKLTKAGFKPQEVILTVKSGEVLTYRVNPFIPQYTITQRGNEENQSIKLKTGNLIIQSLPVEILIESQSLGLKENKSQDEWMVKDLPVGVYRMRFTWKNKILSDNVEIKEDVQNHIFVNLIDGKIENRSIKINKVDTVLINMVKGNTLEKTIILNNAKTIILIYELNGGYPDSEKFNMPEFEDFKVIGGPSSNFTSSNYIIKGKITRNSTSRYLVYIEPLKTGSFVLPEAYIENSNSHEIFKCDKISLIIE